MNENIKINEDVQMSERMRGACDLLRAVMKGSQIIGEYGVEEDGTEIMQILKIDDGISYITIKIDKDKNLTFTDNIK